MRKPILKYVLLISLGTSILITAWLSITSYSKLNTLSLNKAQLFRHQQQQKQTETLLYLHELIIQDVRNYVLTQNRDWLTKYRNSSDDFQYDLDSLLHKKNELPADFAATFQPNPDLLIKLHDLQENVISLTQLGKRDSAISLLESESYQKTSNLYLSPFINLHHKQYERTKQIEEQFNHQLKELKTQIYLLVGCILLGLIILPIQGFYILRFIRRLNQANETLNKNVQTLKVTEAELRDSQLHHKSFFETSQSGIFRIEFQKPMPIALAPQKQFNWIVNHAYIAEMNSRCIEMYALPNPEKVIGKSILKLWDDWDTLQDLLHYYIRSNYNWTNLETSATIQEGQLRYFLSNLSSIIEDGKVLRAWGSQLDITEDKLIENKLKESEELFRTIVTNSTPIVFMYDMNGIIQLSEGKMLQALGRKSGEAVGKSMFELYEDFPNAKEILMKPLRGEFYEGVVTLGELSFEVFYSPHKDADGNIIGAIGMGLDISKRLEAEKALKESESRLSAVLENTVDVILSIDHDYRVLTINSSGKQVMKELLGVQIKEGDIILDHIPDPIKTIWKKRYDRVLAGERYVVEDHFENGDIEYYSDVFFNPIRKEDKVIGAAILSLETTSRKLTEKALQESEQEMSNLLMALDEAALVSITDLNGKIKHANQKYCIYSGYELNEIIGQRHNIFNSGFHSEEFWKELWATISSGKTWRGEMKNQTKSGTCYWVDTVIAPIKKPNGEIYEYLSINYLISDRKSLFDQREELLADLGNYAFQTSHKIRGPLARMLGLTNLLLDHQIAPEKINDILKMIKMTSEELDTIIIEMNETLSRTAYYKMKEKS